MHGNTDNQPLSQTDRKPNMTFTLPTITLLFASLFIAIQVALTALVITTRVSTQTDFLDGGHIPLLLRVRAHGNFTETVPITLMTMALLEMHKLPVQWIWLFGAALLAGRTLHALALIKGNVTWCRITGMTTTLVVMSACAAAGLWMFAR
jgi:uncharacterized protein